MRIAPVSRMSTYTRCILHSYENELVDIFQQRILVDSILRVILFLCQHGIKITLDVLVKEVRIIIEILCHYLILLLYSVVWVSESHHHVYILDAASD